MNMNWGKNIQCIIMTSVLYGVEIQQSNRNGEEIPSQMEGGV